MRAATTFACKEFVELLPALLIGAAIGALLGVKDPLVDGATRNACIVLSFWAGAIGAWQGLLDRRYRSNAFLRHRPGAQVSAQLGRWVVGFTVIAGLFVAYRIGQVAMEASMFPDEILSLQRSMTRSRFQPDPWDVLGLGIMVASAVWALTRMAVSWPGLWTPALLSACVFSGVWVWGVLYPAWPVALVLLSVASLHQIVNLDRPRRVS